MFHDQFLGLVESDTLIQVGDGFGFPEGPVMLPEGYLLFSDIENDAIIRFTRPGRTGVFRQPSGGANGNTLDHLGRLVSCEAGRRRVTRTERDGSITVLADNYHGKRLNSPNDIVVRSDGTVYFTDPIFIGEHEEILAPSYMDLDFCGVFKISPAGTLEVVTTEVSRCNGLAFSPDESILYVVNSADNSLVAFDVDVQGNLSNSQIWLRMEHELSGVGDGMKVDTQGNVYVTGPGGVWVVSADGSPLGIIRLPVNATNMAFYGFDSQMLFITAPPRLYMIRLKVPGIPAMQRGA